MHRSTYSYELPEDLIADRPASPRDASKMMVLDRHTATLQHRNFSDFPDLLPDNSILVVNDSRVIPARLPGKRATGANIEVLLIKEQQPGRWLCKVKNSARIKAGEILKLCQGALTAELEDKTPDGNCNLKFSETENLIQTLEEVGYAPLPPYIHKVRENEVPRKEDLQNYQTVFAREPGAIAAPTAGLHFTEAVLNKIRARGIEVLAVTLHVGAGTFESVRVEDIRQHVMHEETYFISDEVAEKLNHAKESGRIITAVGTTATRTLESAWKSGKITSGSGNTRIFIYPPFAFKAVDQLLTNFHLPESTLLMMVSALAGKDNILNAYNQAVQNRYRFFSYGDCMLIQ
ncbi:MAG: tRNA preQ1(34) S-adenosylmethionine ribosyltransferase-isomerase QueA [Deltaproteobacteria bacterium]|nr:tRNA preQ1(34) S-adenosylmethionine ribosyltransferase-isomerase QueA [Deltaproteobacteria bacterium]MBT4642322.1 tRNA preQ1(34) S-adenosylmethionine ribosyltransferase-isomerase QueA [Deltaproteobacteria bacterium]MBT6503266.1 tRNA preQ1(34) S-adenosylmethionine ribosyltransferase-isomerase QueA [Deltaproteobacteria bacterium]MBT6614094.1 tRNA preQ1(34) S-adenosylmethionine ribosyltransferase-isomerase QueA [Deltaproteobacteria bacterium]MBT7155814.1 tRNA preQ1(34) S-adenosylmethionine ribo